MFYYFEESFDVEVKGKIIDAMYFGMPIVTTTLGSEGINDAKNIMKIADDPILFANKVIDLYCNEIELEKISTLSRLNCERYFSIDYARTQICNFFDEKGIRND